MLTKTASKAKTVKPPVKAKQLRVSEDLPTMVNNPTLERFNERMQFSASKARAVTNAANWGHSKELHAVLREIAISASTGADCMNLTAKVAENTVTALKKLGYKVSEEALANPSWFSARIFRNPPTMLNYFKITW